MKTYMKLQEELADARHAYIDMKERALAAEAALADRDKPCVWTEIPRFVPQLPRRWTVGCSAPQWIDHAPSEFRYCPACGHPIEVAE